MLKFYILYIVNLKTGFSKDLTIRANSTEHARSLFERFCKMENEFVMCIYPLELNK